MTKTGVNINIYGGINQVLPNVKEVEQHMSFGSAIALLKEGFALRRSGWDLNTFIYYVPSAYYKAMTSIAKNICDSDGLVRYSEYIAYLNADKTVVIWKPSESDIFANDWEIVEW